MPVTDVQHDLDTRTITIRARFAAPVARVWQLYTDPRQLEQVWGPPGFPATFVDHELTPGHRVTYYMTSPEGQRFGGYWDITGVEPPTDGLARLTFDDGFADEDLAPNTDLPVSHNVYTFRAEGTETSVTYVTAYDTAEALEQVLQMGMLEGASASINQIDAYLAA